MVRVWLNVYSPTRRSPVSSTATRRAIITIVGMALAYVIDSCKSRVPSPGRKGMSVIRICSAPLPSHRARSTRWELTEIRSQAPDEQIVLKRDGTFNISSARRSVLAHALARRLSTFEEGFADYHAQRALKRQIPDLLGQGNHLGQSRAALVAGKQVLFDVLFFGF